MLSLSLLLVGVCVTQVIGQAVPQCENIERRADKWVIVLEDPGGAIHLTVKVAFKWAWGVQINFDGIRMEEEITHQTRLLRYYVQFPVRTPLPKITKIKFNNKNLCTTKVSPFEGYRIISFDHAVHDRKAKVGSTPSIMAPGFNTVPDSLATGLDASPRPDLSSVPPPLRPSPTQVTHSRPVTTQKPPKYYLYTFLPPSTSPPPSKKPPAKEGQKKQSCGMSVRPQNLMLGGRDVENGDWPWVATLHDARTSVLKCAGVLVSKRFVVIAGHCVIDPIQKTKVKEEELVVIMGKFDFSKWAEREMQPREVRRIMFPPGFSAAPLSNDIALLYLEDDIDYTMYARPVCLLDDAEDIDSLVNQVATVVGWNPGENFPRRAMVPIVSRQECSVLAGQGALNTFCAGNTTASKHCVGDADGGLFLPKVGADGSLRWYLRGVPSSHLQNDLVTCAQEAQRGIVVYTDAAHFTPWIREVVATTRPYHD